MGMMYLWIMDLDGKDLSWQWYFIVPLFMSYELMMFFIKEKWKSRFYADLFQEKDFVVRNWFKVWWLKSKLAELYDFKNREQPI